MIDLRQASLIDFLPDSIASDPEIIALSLSVDPELQSVGQAIIEAVILPRVSELDEDILDELAWAFRLNELAVWDNATVDGKRALLVNIFAIRKKSGTRFAVRRIFDLLSVTGTVIEWFEDDPVAAPYTYRLRIAVSDVGITLEQLLETAELTHRYAAARCQLSELAVESDRPGPLLAYPALTLGRQTTISFGGP